MNLFYRLALTIAIGLTLTACGGGSGGTKSTPTPVVVATSSSSSSTASLTPSSSSAPATSSSSSSSAASSSAVAQSLKLSNPNPSREAVALFDYLKDSYRKKTLTGQQESTWMTDGPLYELNFISKNTGGKAPAILGLDYLNHLDKNYVDGVTLRATDWYLKTGGIPTICWHWGAPTIGQGYDNSKKAFDINKALTEGTTENLAMMKDLDLIAAELTKLRDKGVPVLWRPFHEFTGTWFWWGMGGSENFKKLWIKMYNYYTIDKGLNNLIWVLGYTGEPNASYYPGDQYVDIAGADTYVNDNGSLVTLYNRVEKIVGKNRPIALHENGPIPDPDKVVNDGANWSYFMTWHTSFVTDGKSNTPDSLNKVYNHEHYITKDELPNLPNYKSAN
jgi:mannan endo-1,4-beta-mannosidase